MDNPLVIYSTVLILGQTGMQHNRAKYGALDLLGDLGGVLEVIMILFGFALYPVSEHSFVITAANKLFFARTDREDVFVP